MIDDGGSRAAVMIVDGTEVVVWEAPPGVRPDLAVIERLARLRLDARRRGCGFRLRNPCADMVALIEFLGLAGVFGTDGTDDDVVADQDGAGAGTTRARAGATSVEVVGQAEGGEQARVEEVVEAGEPAVADLDDLDRERRPPT